MQSEDKLRAVQRCAVGEIGVNQTTDCLKRRFVHEERRHHDRIRAGAKGHDQITAIAAEHQLVRLHAGAKRDAGRGAGSADQILPIAVAELHDRAGRGADGVHIIARSTVQHIGPELRNQGVVPCAAEELIRVR